MQELIDSLEDYAGIADIYRLLLLYIYGGVYSSFKWKRF